MNNKTPGIGTSRKVGALAQGFDKQSHRKLLLPLYLTPVKGKSQLEFYCQFQQKITGFDNVLPDSAFAHLQGTAGLFIQSTHPSQVRQDLDAAVAAGHTISIHAPFAECDVRPGSSPALPEE